MKTALFSRAFFPPLVLAVMGLLVYGNSLTHGFLMTWDDSWMVFNDYTTNCSWENIKAICSEFYKGQYSPLNQLLYHGVFRIFGMNPLVFHAGCLLLHFGCGVLVWSLVRCFANRRIAFGVAALFVLHPLQVESVAWISASKILLYAFFLSSGITVLYHLCTTGKGSVLFMGIALFYPVVWWKRTSGNFSSLFVIGGCHVETEF